MYGFGTSAGRIIAERGLTKSRPIEEHWTAWPRNGEGAQFVVAVTRTVPPRRTALEISAVLRRNGQDRGEQASA